MVGARREGTGGGSDRPVRSGRHRPPWAEIASQAILLLVCLAALPAAAKLFLTASEQVGLRLGVPPFVVGVSVVAFGTSAPELIASVIAVLSGASSTYSGWLALPPSSDPFT